MGTSAKWRWLPLNHRYQKQRLWSFQKKEDQAALMLLDLTVLKIRHQFLLQLRRCHQDAPISIRLSLPFLKLRIQEATGRQATWPMPNGSSKGRTDLKVLRLIIHNANEWLNFLTCKCSRILMNKLIIIHQSHPRVSFYAPCIIMEALGLLLLLRRWSQRLLTMERGGSLLKI